MRKQTNNIGKTKYIHILHAVLAIFIITSCGYGRKAEPVEKTNEVLALTDYIEKSENVINTEIVPAMINAPEVFSNLKGSNFLIIDLRSKDEFNEGHIENSVNIRPFEIMNYFENIIEPNSFEKIVLVCANGSLSGYVNSVLLLLGYKDIYSLRFGLSAWDRSIAGENWLSALSSHLEGKLDVAGYPKPAKKEMPVVKSSQSNPYNILRDRAQEVLNVELNDLMVNVNDVISNPDQYFIINYWPITLYEQGHLPGALQYTPKQSLKMDTYLTTLPVDKPIVLYCFTAQHSSFVTAFLRILGYEVYNLDYGANSFIHKTMLETQTFFRSFSEDHIHNYPLVKKGEAVEVEKIIEAEEITVEGGC